MFLFPSSLLLAQASTVNLLAAIAENDLLGKLCIIVLLLLSVVSFATIAQKFLAINRAAVQTRRFQKIIDDEGGWDSLFAAAKKYPDSPVAKLLKETYVECRLENWFDQKRDFPLEGRLEIARTTIEGILLKTMSNEEGRLMSKLGILSTITSLAPFIGLFGTVWGVLAAFQSLGGEGGASIAALAPGISTALVTTIFGLFAAIPAQVAFQYFMAEIRQMTEMMISFSHELEIAVRKQILKEGARAR